MLIRTAFMKFGNFSTFSQNETQWDPVVNETVVKNVSVPYPESTDLRKNRIYSQVCHLSVISPEICRLCHESIPLHYKFHKTECENGQDCKGVFECPGASAKNCTKASCYFAKVMGYYAPKGEQNCNMNQTCLDCDRRFIFLLVF